MCDLRCVVTDRDRVYYGSLAVMELSRGTARERSRKKISQENQKVSSVIRKQNSGAGFTSADAAPQQQYWDTYVRKRGRQQDSSRMKMRTRTPQRQARTRRSRELRGAATSRSAAAKKTRHKKESKTIPRPQRTEPQIKKCPK